MNLPLITEAAHSLQKDFALPAIAEAFSEEDLVSLLTPLIKTMLDRDFEKLLQICYRVDLGEEKLKTILHKSDPETLASDLARALVARQILKAEIRRKYSEG
ncbi:hypothetical protein [Cognataquiflexum rubidum]|uniref:hypothetical protein n=1 Tax=Cognataquiflexum rubidum TaxID=2922273 RepID=UPI001F13F108|nr:hypothetical protein [Cognataquiflexum rubidum]MCH6235982.1 hypothetical protein [Cognataquiflexum rubidum]